MLLTFSLLKKIIPELNKKVITVERIIELLYQRRIEYHEIPLYKEDDGAFITQDGQDYVFIRYALHQILKHETVLHEGCHAFMHVKAPFLQWRQQLEADVFSLVGMIPATELPHLNRIKHQLEPESYEMLMRRNRVKEMWKI